MKLSDLEDDAPVKESKALRLSDLEDDETQAAPATVEKTGAPTSKLDRFVKGAVDPIDALAQLAYNSLPKGAVSAVDQLNNFIAEKTGLVGKVPEGGMNQFISDKEKLYQSDRTAAGESGIDAYRLAGNVASTLPLAFSAPAAATFGGRAAVGAATGAGFGALQPVIGAGEKKLSDLVTGNEPIDFWKEKAKQASLGAAFGAAVPVVLSGAARLISPKASTNPQLQSLAAEGIKPTIGQALGGKAAIAEEKLQSLPILGDMIHRARSQTLDTFNTAAINRAVEPIGIKIEGVGHEAVKKAGDALSKHYDDAISQVKHVKFDAKFDVDLMQLKQMASSLVPDMAKKFNKYASDIVEHRMSPQRSMLGDVYKSVDSEIGKASSKFGKSSTASEQELGDALAQLQNIIKQQMMRSNPDVATKIKAADTGWANLVRVEQAAKAAQNAEGVFTPAQLNAAIRSADDSVRGRAVSRGTALMQDLGSTAQKVIGSKYPDSGTAGRAALGVGAVGAGFYSPAIPVGLAAGGLAYTRPVQNALVSMISKRPQSAQSVAEMLRELSRYGGALAPAGNALAEP